MKYGLLTFIEDLGVIDGKTRWRCQCDCGKMTVAIASNVKSGNTQSCGHVRKANAIAIGFVRKHGLGTDRMHARWNSMIHRCTNPKAQRYADYGVEVLRSVNGG